MRSVSFTGPDGQRVCAHHLGGPAGRSGGPTGRSGGPTGQRGEPLVIAHAAGFCGGAYTPMAAALADRFDVWAIDLRGHGDSPAPADGDLSWNGMARDVQTVIAGLELGPVAFFGHSLGGAAGMRAEALTPGILRAIYVYEPAVLPVMDGVEAAGAQMADLTRRRRHVFASREEAAGWLGARPPYDTMCDDAIQAFITHGTRNGDGSSYRLKCVPAVEAAVYEADKIYVTQVADVAVPVLIGIGTREKGLPAAAAPLITAALPDARTESYPELGHLGPLENPRLIAERVALHLAPAAEADNVRESWSGRP